eukprot:15455192-Alexandrium_andersonii.AAC.1
MIERRAKPGIAQRRGPAKLSRIRGLQPQARSNARAAQTVGPSWRPDDVLAGREVGEAVALGLH